MVSIVIDNRYAADLTFFLETTFGAAKFLKTDTGMFHGNAHLIGQGDGSQSIADIVDTRNVQHKMTEQGISFIAVKGRMCEFVKRWKRPYRRLRSCRSVLLSADPGVQSHC